MKTTTTMYQNILWNIANKQQQQTKKKNENKQFWRWKEEKVQYYVHYGDPGSTLHMYALHVTI